MTVCRLQHHNIEAAVNELLLGVPEDSPPTAIDVVAVPDTTEDTIDLQETADQQIRDYIGARFKTHELERLVEEVLRAKGYTVQRTLRGADGGVDLAAGHGPMGFESPRMIVQVKSQGSPVDVKVLRELKGVMHDFGADHGLIVAWGGFQGSIGRESMRHFFQVRLWTGDDLIRELQDVYDRLSETIRAEIPLKRIWTLASEEE